MYSRALEQLVFDPEITQKMILLAGPRQVGKTTLAQKWLVEKAVNLYYNWDDEKVRREFRLQLNICYRNMNMLSHKLIYSIKFQF